MNIITPTILLPLLSHTSLGAAIFIAFLTGLGVTVLAVLWSCMVGGPWIGSDSGRRQNFAILGVYAAVIVILSAVFYESPSTRLYSKAKELAAVLNSNYSVQVVGSVNQEPMIVVLNGTPKIQILGASRDLDEVSVRLDADEALAVSRMLATAPRSQDTALLKDIPQFAFSK